MNVYKEIKNKNQKRLDNLSLGFAFNKEQFKNMMEKWGFKENDIDKICSLGNGAFIKKCKLQDYYELVTDFRQEHKKLIEQDKTGEGYIKDMFLYELVNHEYSYTLELDETLDSLGLTYEQVMKNDALRKGLELAKKEILNSKDEIEL